MSRPDADFTERRLDRRCQVRYTGKQVRELLVLYFNGAKDSTLAPEPGMRKTPPADPATQGDLMAALADLQRALSWAVRTEEISHEKLGILWLYFSKNETQVKIGTRYGISFQLVSDWIEQATTALANAMTLGLH